MSEKGLRFIAKNTAVLYVRMLFIMIISLYTVRVVLNVLGVEDYGIYDVVAGVVTTMSFLSSVISSAVLRFYSFSMGENQNEKLKQIFSVSISIFLVISIIVIVIGESFGLWFINTQLTIPADRIVAANWVYQFAIFIFVASIISVPYYSAIIAHENMKTYAMISIIQYVLILTLVLLLPFVTIDKLIGYGFLMFASYFIVTLIYIYVSRTNYDECHYEHLKDKKLFKDMLFFSGWTMFGTVAGVANNQGNNILLNIFFGPVVNAARSIAFQVSNALLALSNNFFMAVRPPLIKSYAEGNMKETMRIFYFSNKFTYYLLFLICLPLMLETEYILNLWLNKITDQMVVFTQLTLIYSLILSLNNPITILIQASGNIKRYSYIVESCTLLSLPLSYIFFKLGFGAQSTFWIMIIVFVIAHILRLLVLQKEIDGFMIRDYFLKFAIQAITISFISLIISYLIRDNMVYGIRQLLSVLVTSTVSIVALAYLIGLNKNEKQLLKNYLNGIWPFHLHKQ